MEQGVIPSLSLDGWVTSSKDILAYNLSHYILSDAAQSIAFQNNIINLPETYYKHINNPIDMANAVKIDLEKILSSYFVSVDVTADTKEISAKKYAILIYASVIDGDNIKHELSKITEINTSGIRKIIDMNNYGDARQYLLNI